MLYTRSWRRFTMKPNPLAIPLALVASACASTRPSMDTYEYWRPFIIAAIIVLVVAVAWRGEER